MAREPKVWLTTDNHFEHTNIVKHGHRPANHSELQMQYWQEMIKQEDYVFCLGDFSLGNPASIRHRLSQLPGRKFITLGNHDSHSALWYMKNGFDFAANGILYRDIWFSHIPVLCLPQGATVNIHGHLHDSPPERHAHTPQDFHRLLAIEHTGYKPVELDKFLVGKY